MAEDPAPRPRPARARPRADAPHPRRGTRAPPPAPPARAARAPARARASSPAPPASRAAAAKSYGEISRRACTLPEARRAGGRKATGAAPTLFGDSHMGTVDFPAGFFERAEPERPATSGLDDAATAAVRDLYSDLGIDGRVLDLCGASAEHFDVPPDDLIVFGGDPNAKLPYGDDAFDDVLCSGGVGSMTHPRETFDEVARVVRPGGRFVCTFARGALRAGRRAGLGVDRRRRPRADRPRVLLARRRPSARPRATCVRRSPARATASGRSGPRSAARRCGAACCCVSCRTPSHHIRSRARSACPGSPRRRSAGRCRSAPGWSRG